jgi:beta-xylosidase
MVGGANTGKRFARSAIAAGALLCAVFLVSGLAAPAGADVVRVPASLAAGSCRGASARRQVCPSLARRGGPAAPYQLATTWYQNPVSGRAPDPFGFELTGSAYLLYSTGNLFPIEISDDLIHWTSAGTAFAQRPAWVVQQGEWHAWSPNVIHVNRLCPAPTLLYGLAHQLTASLSCYYLYYVGYSARFSVNCVAVASAMSPLGPFVDQGPLSNGALDAQGRPIGCGDDVGYGNIDPAPFQDSDGRAYLYVSTDFQCRGGAGACRPGHSVLRPTVSAMALAPDLLRVSGGRVPLFHGTQAWQRSGSQKVVEGPSMEKHDGVYHLIYSGGSWRRRYAMGDATLVSPLGPVRQDPRNPMLAQGSNVYSPGGGSTVVGPHGGEWIVYHARLGGYNRPRQLFIDRLVWNPDGSPTVAGPTSTPQSPAP